MLFLEVASPSLNRVFHDEQGMGTLCEKCYAQGMPQEGTLWVQCESLLQWLGGEGAQVIVSGVPECGTETFYCPPPEDVEDSCECYEFAEGVPIQTCGCPVNNL